MVCLLALMVLGQENILKNADCKEIRANGVPVGWYLQNGTMEHGGDGGAEKETYAVQCGHFHGKLYGYAADGNHSHAG